MSVIPPLAQDQLDRYGWATIVQNGKPILLLKHGDSITVTHP